MAPARRENSGYARLYGSKDPRDRPLYPLSEAAQYLCVPTSTLRSWLRGRPGRPPLIRPASAFPLALSFWNVVEAQVLRGIRSQHSVPLLKVRRALGYVERELGLRRPLISKTFLTDGSSLFVEHLGRLVDATEAGQLAMKELIAAGLDRIEHDEQGLARKLFLWSASPGEARLVSVDPLRSFGRPVIEGTSVPVEALVERWKGGDRIADIAHDFRLQAATVESVLQWERRGAA